MQEFQSEKSKHTVTDFSELKKSFLEDVVRFPPELVMNWDQIGIKLVPLPSWTMEKWGSKRVEVAVVGDKCQITVVFVQFS